MDSVQDLWGRLPAFAQDLTLLTCLLLPAVLIGIAVVRGYQVRSLVLALLWRFRATNALFVILMALSVGLGIALLAQERALLSGTARAAEKFDVIVAAPGDRIQMLLSTVFLQPNAVPLLGGDVLTQLQADEQIDLIAPIAFGDSYQGMPVIGTTAAFVTHLAGEPIEGQVFTAIGEGVAGASVPIGIGEILVPVHGRGSFVEHEHTGNKIRITGRLRPTGSPWDRAILVPVEAVFKAHSMFWGHGPEDSERIGPPFEPAFFPGVPAFVLHSDELYKNYSVRARYSNDTSMAFFPGAVLARLHTLLGDVRGMMSLMASLTQVLVAAGVLSGLVVLVRLFAQRFALLRALGAPRRFNMAVVWTYCTFLIAIGCLLGVALGWIAAGMISDVVAARTDIAMRVELGLYELILVVAFFSFTSLLALLPACAAYRRPVIDDIRGH